MLFLLIVGKYKQGVGRISNGLIIGKYSREIKDTQKPSNDTAITPCSFKIRRASRK
jgi:hypothetical protein